MQYFRTIRLAYIEDLDSIMKSNEASDAQALRKFYKKYIAKLDSFQTQMLLWQCAHLLKDPQQHQIELERDTKGVVPSVLGLQIIIELGTDHLKKLNEETYRVQIKQDIEDLQKTINSFKTS